MAKTLGFSRKELQKRLHISGLNVLSSALTLMQNELLNACPSYESIDDFIKQFTNVVVNDLKVDNFLIDLKTAHEAIDQLREQRVSRTGDNELLVKNVIGTEGNKSFLQHFKQLSKHLERHPYFKGSNNDYKLFKIDSLITSEKEAIIDCLVFGFLRRNRKKIEFVVEDDTGSVDLYFTEDTEFIDDLIVENSFVLIEGIYNSSEDMLKVNSIGQSPPIDLKSTKEASDASKRVGRMIVVLSDIHLDDEQTLDKLQTLFTGYNSMVPIPDAFIFVGDFLSQPFEDVSDFKAHMKDLVKLISRFDKISQLSQIIFVPGFNDTNDTNGQHIPKPSFPVDMFPHTTTKLNNYYLATNPVNIYIDGRHICLFAFPLYSKLKPNIFHKNIEEKSEIGSAVAKHIICNAHLTAGTTKSWDNCLSLFHPPDFLLFTDNAIKDDIEGNAFEFVDLVKLPSFTNNQFKFKVFYTNPKLVENSQILV